MIIIANTIENLVERLKSSYEEMIGLWGRKVRNHVMKKDIIQ